MPTRSIGHIGKLPANGTECFEAMQRHHVRGKQTVALRHVAGHSTGLPRDATMPVAGYGHGNGTKNIAAAPPGSDGGDILYGAAAIARFMFSIDFIEHPTRARRRVFNLWAFYEKR